MNNIVLMGFMGAGKTSVGTILAQKLKLKYIDIDEEIEKKTGKQISEIFKEKGEPYFRSLEKETVKEISSIQNAVISAGGGTVLDEENVAQLKKNSFIVYLKAPFNVLYDRIKESSNRPLLAVYKPEEEMQALLEARQMTYESVADLVVDVSIDNVEEIAEEIAEKYKY
jgi:shikimate kinase